MNNRRVFVLGAGASKDATRNSKISIPLAREFFKSNYVNKLWPDNHLKDTSFSRSNLLEFLCAFFRATYKDKRSGKKYLTEINEDINIEEVFSLLDFIESGDFYFSKEIFKIKKAKFELLRYLFNCLQEFPFEYYETELYAKILNSLSPGDSIITYNWDCLIENYFIGSTKGKEILKSLDTALNPYSGLNEQYFDETSFNKFHKSYFLKLHGSINWYNCPDKSCVRHHIPAIYDFEKDIFALMWACDFCGAAMNMMILPPHVHKSYRSNRFFSLQAKIASQKLSLAEEIVVIGYSFPDFDFEANTLFKRSVIDFDESSWYQFPRKIVVVDPQVTSDNYVQKVKKIFLTEEIEIFDSVKKFNKYYKF